VRFIILLLTCGAIVAGSGPVAAADGDSTTAPSAHPKKSKHKGKGKKQAHKGKAKAKAKSDLQTDVKFDDSVLHGQYQTPEEALAKVENEKGLNDLLGVRKHFKDRLATASEQE
jgi:hypothetical protein